MGSKTKTYRQSSAFALMILLVSGSNLWAQTDTLVRKEPKFGSVLRTVRPFDICGDTTPEIFQVETNKALKFKDIRVRFAIYQGRKRIYSADWKAESYFDPKDNLPDSIKWRRLQRIMTYFFSNQNFLSNTESSLEDILAAVVPVDIQLGSPEADEFSASPHTVFSVYAGRDNLYGITYLRSRKKFVTVWRN